MTSPLTTQAHLTYAAMKDSPLQPTDDGRVRFSAWLGVRPASTLAPLYEYRLAHVEANLKYWNDEYARHGDPIAEAAWRAAQKTVGDVWQKLNMLKQPGAVTPNASR